MVFGLQKASVSKRISAYIFDFIIFVVIVTGLALLLSAIVGYDGYIEKLDGFYKQYEYEYGVKADITQEEYAALSETDKAKYDEASKAFGKDEEVLKIYSMLLTLSTFVVSFSILLAYVVTEIVIPIIFKNGQTLGKKIFGIAVMRVDGIKIAPLQLFTRAILGKYAIETMVPVMLVIMMFLGIIGAIGPIVIVALMLLQVIVIIATKTNSAIHDLLACTVTVDMSTQLIFDSEESMIEYKKQLAEKKANEQPYF